MEVMAQTVFPCVKVSEQYGSYSYDLEGWRSQSMGFVRGGGCRRHQSQEERMGGASWALNMCTSQGTRARTRHGQRVYLRKLKM